MIKPLVKDWAPNAFVVSFKLETDPSLLFSKARASLKQYGHQMVIGNVLETRKRTVICLSLTAEIEISLTEKQVESGVEIERDIVNVIINHHSKWINEN